MNATVYNFPRFPMQESTDKKDTATVATRLDRKLLGRFLQCVDDGGFLNKGDALRDAVREWTEKQEQKRRTAIPAA